MRRINCHHPEYAQTVTISGGDLLGRENIWQPRHSNNKSEQELESVN